MTQDEIKKNAEEYAFALTRSDEVAEHIIHGYIKGANSVLNPWHKASDELPPISEPREESADCLLAVIGRQVKVGGKMYLTGFYDHEVRDWHIYGTGYSQMTNIMVLEWQLIQKQ